MVKEAIPNTPLERSEVIRAVIVRTCKELKRDNGMIIRYDDNVLVVIDQEGNPKGTRIFGAIARKLRQLNFTKIVSLAPEVNVRKSLRVSQLSPKSITLASKQNVASKGSSQNATSKGPNQNAASKGFNLKVASKSLDPHTSKQQLNVATTRLHSMGSILTQRLTPTACSIRGRGPLFSRIRIKTKQLKHINQMKKNLKLNL
ncbi:hypothetical protein V6N13_107700 [Hibiscus sabdariffa]|uniref:Ribosomal protein L14 n=1 Tax=Hibiscus sabdariffa TaxID=183260 RepID=A0ABR2SQY7_9ROSI